ncbi:hypothetical protein GOV06_04905 [Candidatus Woesearchaeota archaeon]|nr:hypothetical protein [Candidatus Woesearchaeota archaeon]
MSKKEGSEKQKVTLSIDSKTYHNYQKFCEEHALMLSKKIELFMKQELEETKEAQ